MNRLILALLIGSHFVVGFLGYQWASGKEAKKEVKIILENVENHNEDQTELHKNTIEIQTETTAAKIHNKRIEDVPTSADCYTPELKQLWHETKFTRK